MALTELQRRELDELLAALADGRLDESRQQRLRQWLTDPEVQEYYVRHVMLVACLDLSSAEFAPTLDMLRPANLSGEGDPAWLEQFADTTCRCRPKSPAKRKSPMLGFLRSLLRVGNGSPVTRAAILFAMTLSAGTLLTLLFGIVLALRGPRQAGSRELSAARLTATSDCRWTDGSNAPEVGDELAPGRKLVLEAGLAEIAFQGGARALLEGPATLEVGSGSSSLLQQGKVTVTVADPSARGFEIDAPGMKYTDLGTEFGVLVAPDGGQEMHVFRGRVQAEAGGREQGAGSKEQREGRSDEGSPLLPGEGKEAKAVSQPLILTAHQALRIASPGKPIERFTADETRFFRRMPEPFPLFSTGVGLDRGANDPHWDLVAVSTDPGFRPRAAVVAQPTNQVYFRPSRDKAQWLSLSDDFPNMPKDCVWFFRTKFDLTGFDSATARIEGQLCADDFLIELRLNGKPLPLPAGLEGRTLFAQETPLRIDRNFSPGVNTLEVVIKNHVGPMALMIDWHGTARRAGEK